MLLTGLGLPVKRIMSPNFKDTGFVSPVFGSLINKDDPMWCMTCGVCGVYLCVVVPVGVKEQIQLNDISVPKRVLSMSIRW